jgi:hypothetical protein
MYLPVKKGLGEICLDSDILDLDDFRNHFKYEKVICEVCEKLAECLHAMPVWVCEITELCPGWVDGDDDDDNDDDECEDPTAYAGPDQSVEVCPQASASINLVGSGTGTPTLSFSWDFDISDGITVDSTEQNPSGVLFVAGTYTVTLTVTNACNTAADTMTVTITECINHAPALVSPSRQAISAESHSGSCIPTYKYTVVATDPDSDNLKFSLVANSYGNIPSGMVINEDTGVITGWTQECCGGATRCHKCCTECVKVKVVDDGCCGPLFDEMEFCIEVWVGAIDGDTGGTDVGIGFDGCPIDQYSCP